MKHGWQKAVNGINVIYFIATINFLFLLGTIIGLGIFGFGPSLIATHKLAKIYHKKELGKVVRPFFDFYKEALIVGNKIFLPIEIIAFIYYENILLLPKAGLSHNTFIIVIFVIIQVLLAAIVAILPALYVYYQIDNGKYITKSIQFIFHSPVNVLLSVLWFAFCVIGSKFLPGIIPFFSFGLWIFGNMAIYLHTFDENEEKLNHPKGKSEVHHLLQRIQKESN